MQTSIAGKPPSTNPAHRERGFTYVMALVAIVLVGIFAGVANLATSRIVQADRERELLFRGQAYRSAIKHYYAAEGHYPRSLQELLKDPHFAQRVYLRALYADPMASEDERKDNGGWRLIRAADGGIAGVASRSKREPLKQANFPLGLESFEQAKGYADWIFEYEPQVVGGGAAMRGPLSAPAGSFR
jgi:type II secretory pathway pseudopilin PulG